MKKMVMILFCVSLFSLNLAFADGPAHTLHGSDTLAGAITDAIIAAGMDKEVVYVGGGSGTGETAILNGDQGIAPMSRPVSAQAADLAKSKGLALTPHVLGLDGIGIFVNDNNSLKGVDFA